MPYASPTPLLRVKVAASGDVAAQNHRVKAGTIVKADDR